MYASWEEDVVICQGNWEDGFPAESTSEENLVEKIGEIVKKSPDAKFFSIRFQLPALVARIPEKGTVCVTSGKKESVFPRRARAYETGKTTVSCRGRGILTINLHFRPYDDERTDRGIVWITPGKEAATAHFGMRLENGIHGQEESCLMALLEAKTAVESFLRRFE